jgi:hypothetical protein
MRKVYETQSANKVARVFVDTEWGEYRVQFFVTDTLPTGGNGKPILLKDADYHTNDKQDAISTANHWVKGN